MDRAWPRRARARRGGLASGDVCRRRERANNKLENQTGIFFPWASRGTCPGTGLSIEDLCTFRRGRLG